jgi:redox-sensitive bicupin YhaK (pirin superfamily)
VYWVQGNGECEGAPLTRHDLALLDPDTTVVVSAREPSRFMLLGGEPLDGPRHIWWNFVSSSQQRIVAAARRWKDGGYPKVAGDEQEFIPLTDEPPFAG